MTKFVHIVAVSTNGVIGNDDKLPWSIPSDLKFFKETTLNHWCIVGRKTYDTIKHLKNRNFIVITRQQFEDTDIVKYVSDVESAIALAKTLTEAKCYVIGGAEIYRQTFPYVDKLLVTYVEKNVEGNAFYEIPDNFQIHKSSDPKCENGNLFYFMQYKKVAEKPLIAELIELQRAYDKANPNSGLTIDPEWTREETRLKLKEFFDKTKDESLL